MITARPNLRGLAPLLAAILLPLVAFVLLSVTLDQARRHEEARTDLAQRASQSAASVAERLLLADAALAAIRSRPLHDDAARGLAGEPVAPFFSQVAYIDLDGERVDAGDARLRVPPVSGAARIKLDAGEPAIVLGGHGPDAPRVWLLRKPPQATGERRTVVAALDPDFLWGARGDASKATGLRVLSADGRVLHAAPPVIRDDNNRVDPSRTLTPSGELEWADHDGRHLASYRPIRIADRFALPDWTLVVSRRAPEAPSVASMASGLAAALGFSVLAAAWLSRSGRWLPGALGAGNTKDSDRSPAQAAVGAIGGGSADTEVRALAGFAEIDRAILSRASIDRIMETVMRHACAVLGCDLVAIAAVVRDTPARVRTLSRIACGTLMVDRDELPPTLATEIARHPEGRLLDDPSGYPFLARLSATGARRFLLLPVYCDGRLASMLCLGRLHPPLGDEALVHAREFASRLGVALTATARAEEAHFLGHFESVTALPNRRHFRQRLSQEISRAGREKRSLVLLYIDLDQFKRVNDSAGHDAGDAVLKEAATRLRRHLREEDMLAHFGGDEFVLLLPGISGAADAGRVAEKLIALLSQPFSIEGNAHHLSASIGIGMYPNDGRTADALLQNTDSAMSRAKSAGRSQYVFFEEQINSRLAEQFALESELRRALAQQELVLFYQPQIDVRSGKLVGAEALIRWQHPKRGLLPPGAFIEIAEDCGLIEQIGEYTRRVACAQHRDWEARGIALDRISVNVSGRELKRRDFVARLEAVLLEYGLRPYALEIEITERTLVEDSDQVLLALKTLRHRGMRIAIDDFGTGYSSLSYLKRMPFDMLKVDRSFITDIGTAGDAESCAVASAVLGIAHSLGKEVCAEGVETEAQRAYLAERGCELVQGYLISRPLPAGEFETFMRKWGHANAQAPEQPERVPQTLAA